MKKTDDFVVILEIARVGIAMVGDEIAEELDISDEELQRIREVIQNALED